MCSESKNCYWVIILDPLNLLGLITFRSQSTLSSYYEIGLIKMITFVCFYYGNNKAEKTLLIALRWKKNSISLFVNEVGRR